MQKIIWGTLVAGSLLTAAQNSTFEQVFGGDEDDIAKAVISVDDGYLVAGKTNSWSKYRNYDAWLIKIDKNGKKVWEQKYGGEDDESINKILPYGKGYLLFGSTETYGNERLSYYLSHVNTKGEEQWAHAFYTNEDDEFYGKAITTDGDDILFGGTQRHLKFFSADVEPQLFKIDKERETVWRGYYGGEDEDYANAVINTGDGYLMVGTSESYSEDEFDGYVVKIDKNGKKLWHNIFGGEDDDIAYDVVPTKDGGYLIVGSTDSFDMNHKDIYVVKIDKTGKILWQKLYGGERDDEGYAIIATKDGNYVITGYTDSFGRKNRGQLYLIKITPKGKKLWSRAYGGESDDAGYDVVATEDGGYLVVGDKKSERSRDSNVWVLKVDSKGRQ